MVRDNVAMVGEDKVGGLVDVEGERTMVDVAEMVVVTGDKVAMDKGRTVMGLAGVDVDRAMMQVEMVVVTGDKAAMDEGRTVMGLAGVDVDRATVETERAVTVEAMARGETKSHPATMAEAAAEAEVAASVPRPGGRAYA